MNALTPPPAEEDTPTPRQHRHDALNDLTTNWLDHVDTPTVGGEKPHISLIVDLPALQEVARGTHQTENGQVLTIETIQQVACDSTISRIVIGPNSEVLDVRRKTRIWTNAQRRAIIARDRHCQWPGCNNNPRWCDIHHNTPWTQGRPTSIDNATLYCRYHHTKTHLQQTKQQKP